MRSHYTLISSGVASRRWTVLSVAAVCALALPAPAYAQLNGVPVWGPGMPNLSKANEVLLVFNGTTGADFLGLDNSGERGFTASYRRAFKTAGVRFTATGGIGAIERDVAPATRQVMGQAYASLAGSHRFPGRKTLGAISLLGGFGYSGLPESSDEKNLVAAVDGTFRYNPGGWVLDLWVVPRWSWRWTTLANATASQNGVGLTVGFNWGFVGGLMLLFSVDKLWLRESGSSPPLPKTEPFSYSLGLLLNF